MKKFILSIVAVCLSVLVFALVGCGGSVGKTEEEQFNEAKQQFDNYTANINMSVPALDFEMNTVLMIDGTKGKLTCQMSNSTEELVRYYEERYGSVFKYDTEWVENSSDTIEEATAYYNGFIYVVSLFFYDDFEKQGDYLVAKDSALESYANQYNLYGLSSIKIKLENGRITTATAIANMYIFNLNGERAEITYTFSNYGSTEVDLPA